MTKKTIGIVYILSSRNIILLVRSLQKRENRKKKLMKPTKRREMSKVIIKEKVTRQMSLSLGSTKMSCRLNLTP